LLLSGFQLHAQKVLTLADCRQLATSHNKTLQMAKHKVDAAESLRKAAQTQYLPNISANGGYIRNQKNLSLLGEDQYLPIYNYDASGNVSYSNSCYNGWTVVNGSAVPLDANNQPFDPKTNPEKILWKSKAYIPKDAFELDIKNIFVGGITLTQPLYLGGKIRALNRIAESGKKLAQAQQEGSLSDIIVDTDAAYWRIISLVHKKKLAEGYLNLLEKLDVNLRKSVAFGVATKSEALSVKVKLNEAELALVQVDDGLSLSRMALAQICGLPMDNPLTLADESSDSLQVESPNYGTTLETVNTSNRFEIKSLEQLVKIAEANQDVAVSRFLPNVALSANYLVSNPNVFNGVDKSFAGAYQIGVVVNVPVFHFGERIHTLRAAKEEKAVATLQLEEAKEKVELDIRQANFRFQETARKARLTATGKQKADENLRYANIGFEAGTINATTLMEAQTAWLKACSEDIDARIDAQLCKVYLQKALGNIH
jgi:outer membrane protein